MKIEHDNFVTYGIGVTEAVLDEETIDYSQADEQDDGFEGADFEFDFWYEGNSFETDWGYVHGNF